MLSELYQKVGGKTTQVVMQFTKATLTEAPCASSQNPLDEALCLTYKLLAQLGPSAEESPNGFKKKFDFAKKSVFKIVSELCPSRKCENCQSSGKKCLWDTERLMEVVVAYGNGWRRPKYDPNAKGWEGIWDNASNVLANWIKPYIKQADKWLSNNKEYEAAMGNELNDNNYTLYYDLEAALLALNFVGKNLTSKKMMDLTISCEQNCTCIGVEEIDRFQQSVYRVDSAAMLIPASGTKGNCIEVNPGDLLVVSDTYHRTVITVVKSQANRNRRTKPPSDKSKATGRRQKSLNLLPGDKAELKPWKKKTDLLLNKLPCSCGQAQCEKVHTIRGWDPVAGRQKGPEWVSLSRFFLPTAVKGAAKKGTSAGNLKSNAFRYSMYFSQLRNLPSVNIRLAWLRVRDRENGEAPGRIVCIGGESDYQRDPSCTCTRCGKLFDLPKTDRDILDQVKLNDKLGQELLTDFYEKEKKLQEKFEAETKGSKVPPDKEVHENNLLRARLQLARKIEKFQMQNGGEVYVWCPFCDPNKQTVRGLPERPTFEVWSLWRKDSRDIRKLGVDTKWKNQSHQSGKNWIKRRGGTWLTL